MKHKRTMLLVVCLSLVMTFAFAGVASAAGEPGVEEVSFLSTQSELSPAWTDVLIEGAKSTSVPTSFWNLAGNPYTATIVEMRHTSLYTNYYFRPNSANKINVTYTFYNTGASGYYVTIGLYDMVQKKVVSSWNTDRIGGGSTSNTIGFFNLVSGRNYAIKFTPEKSLSAMPCFRGTAKVFHP